MYEFSIWYLVTYKVPAMFSTTVLIPLVLCYIFCLGDFWFLNSWQSIDQCYMHIIVSHWNSYIIALTFFKNFYDTKTVSKDRRSTTYENIITLSKDCSFRGLVIIIFYTMNNQALCYRIKIPVGNFQRENCPSWWRIIIYILQVGSTDFTPLIGKTVSFELYIGNIGGGHL